jgi:hypothetical protein
MLYPTKTSKTFVLTLLQWMSYILVGWSHKIEIFISMEKRPQIVQ